MVNMPKSMHFREWRLAKECNVLCRDRRKAESNTSKRRKCNSLFKHVVVLVLATLCGGCAVGPNFATPTPPVLPPSNVLKGNEPVVPLDTWWQVFADEKLNALISKGYPNNLDARVAYERVIEARSNLQLQSARYKGNPNLLSWQAGLFGKRQRSKEAAVAELVFEENEAQFVRQTLLSDIAQCYLRVRLLQNQHDLAQQSIAVEEQTALLVEQRKQAGLSNNLDLAQTRSLQQRIMAIQADIRQQLEVELNQLSVLVGEAPSFEMRDYIGFAPIPLVPPMIDVGFPADLLRRRPDVRREESALAAAVARIGIAEADLFRSLPLLGTISAGSQKISGMFQSGLLGLGSSPTIRWDSSRFDRVASNVKNHESQCRQAFHTYQNTVIEAAREVEDALARHRSYYAQMLLLNQAVSEDEIAVELSLQRYDAGQAEFQTFLDAREQLVFDLQARAQTQADAVEQLIRLYNALGGTWRPANVIPVEVVNPIAVNPIAINPIAINPIEGQNNVVNSPVRPPVIYRTHPSESEQFDQQQGFLKQNPIEAFSSGTNEQIVPHESFSNPSTQPGLQQSILAAPSDSSPLPPLPPLPSPEAYDGFPAIEDADLLDPPLPKTESGLPVQKVPHKVPEP